MTDCVRDSISQFYWKVARFLGNALGLGWFLVIRNLNLIISATKALNKQAPLYCKTDPFIMPWRVGAAG